MNPTQPAKLLLVVLSTSFLLACGSSSSSPGPTGTAKSFRGEITSLDGGMTVNGVTFKTSGATVRLPDETVTSVTLSGETQVRTVLALGMVVTVKGSSSDDVSGEAAEIEFEHALEGEVESHGPGHVDVMGEHVSIDADTRIVDRHGDPLSSDDLSDGTRIEVSGHGDSRGGVSATFVRVRDDRNGEDQEVKAWVVAVNGALIDLSFVKGGAVAFQIDVSGISPAPVLAVGNRVEVKTNGTVNAAGALVALAVHKEDEGEREAETHVEGIVTELTADGFWVAGQQVRVSGTTRFEGGTVDDVIPGAKVEAEGTLGSDGVLVAEKVEFKPSARIEANVEALDATAGTLTMLGLTVYVTPSTEGSLAGLALDYDVEIRGTMTRDGLGINATRIDLKDTRASDRAFLRGLVTAKGASSVTIAGIEANLTGASFQDLSGGSKTLEQFLALVTPGQTIVKVRWRPYPASTSEPVDEAELEN
jgi:hypothetical protein